MKIREILIIKKIVYSLTQTIETEPVGKAIKKNFYGHLPPTKQDFIALPQTM